MPKIVKILIIILIISGLLSVLFRYFPDVSSSDDKFHVVYYLLLLSVIGSGMALRFKSNISGSLKQAAIWAIIFISLIVLYGLRNDMIMVKERLLAELLPSRATITQEGTIEFKISSDGHFRINTLVNGNPVRFMLDTGASDVVIPPHIARNLGIDIKSLNYSKIYHTANGIVRGAPFTIKTIKIGNFRFHDVKASVNEAEMESPLLGMSFLEKLSGYEVENGKLILKP